MACCVVQTAPGITPALVERLVASRQDLTKADIREVGTAMHSIMLHAPAVPSLHIMRPCSGHLAHIPKKERPMVRRHCCTSFMRAMLHGAKAGQV